MDGTSAAVPEFLPPDFGLRYAALEVAARSCGSWGVASGPWSLAFLSIEGTATGSDPGQVVSELQEGKGKRFLAYAVTSNRPRESSFRFECAVLVLYP